MKRFTDTEKWQPWFRKLPVAYKAFWFFLCDHCDSAGVWERDDEVARLYVDPTLDIPAALDAFNSGRPRIALLRDGQKWFLVDFIPFQYSKGLKRNCKPHAPVYRDLRKHGISPQIYEILDSIGYREAIENLKDKDTDKDKEKRGVWGEVKGQEGEREKPGLAAGNSRIKPFDPQEAFDCFFRRFRNKVKKSKALEAWLEIVTDGPMEARVMAALERYHAHLDAEAWKKPQEAHNWLREWGDWEDYAHESPELKTAMEDARRAKEDGHGRPEQATR